MRMHIILAIMLLTIANVAEAHGHRGRWIPPVIVGAVIGGVIMAPRMPIYQPRLVTFCNNPYWVNTPFGPQLRQDCWQEWR